MKTWLVVETYVGESDTVIAVCSSEQKAKELALAYLDIHLWKDLRDVWRQPTSEKDLKFYCDPENSHTVLYASPGHNSWSDSEHLIEAEIACYIAIRPMLADMLFGIPPVPDEL